MVVILTVVGATLIVVADSVVGLTVVCGSSVVVLIFVVCTSVVGPRVVAALVVAAVTTGGLHRLMLTSCHVAPRVVISQLRVANVGMGPATGQGTIDSFPTLVCGQEMAMSPQCMVVLGGQKAERKSKQKNEYVIKDDSWAAKHSHEPFERHLTLVKLRYRFVNDHTVGSGCILWQLTGFRAGCVRTLKTLKSSWISKTVFKVLKRPWKLQNSRRSLKRPWILARQAWLSFKARSSLRAERQFVENLWRGVGILGIEARVGRAQGSTGR